MNKIVFLLLVSISIVTTSCLKEDDGIIEIPPLTGAVMNPEMGGAAQPNQIWIDLSTTNSTQNHRNDWDLGFYSGDEFYVILNNSIMMAAASIDETNIDAVSESDFAEVMSIINPGAGFPAQYIDDVKGDYYPNGTAIKVISDIDEQNKVYLLKMGYKTYEGDIPAYSTYTAGDARGYKKIRILRHSSNSYKVLIADLNDTTHQEFIIPKESNHHFAFLNIENQALVNIQPIKENWDICFTVWNNIIEGHGTYIYPDFVLTNRLSGVGAYMITSDALNLESEYINFTIEDVDPSLFNYSDQRIIGGTWRSTVSGTTSTPIVHNDRFYVLRDPDGVYYKIRFISMLNENNERGFPIFEYSPL